MQGGPLTEKKNHLWYGVLMRDSKRLGDGILRHSPRIDL